ncbi:MAG: FliM/FliN family flagellar motor switch protein [Pseudomonadota bacterium]
MRSQPVLTAHRALRLALSRVAEKLYGVDLSVEGIAADQIKLEDILPSIPANALVQLVDGSGDAQGVLVMPSPIVGALVEIQTIGHITEKTPEGRPSTPTDAALARRFSDDVLRAFGELLRDVPGEEWTQGYLTGDAMFDTRPLPLFLHDIPYRRLRAPITLAGDARTGEIDLILPAEAADGRGRDLRQQAADSAEKWQNAIEGRVLDSAVQLTADLARLSLPLSRVRKLEPGHLLSVPIANLRNVRLHALDGAVVASGRLGMANGAKAVMVSRLGPGGPEGGHDGDTPLPPPDAVPLNVPDLPEMPALPDIPPMEMAAPEVTPLDDDEAAEPTDKLPDIPGLADLGIPTDGDTPSMAPTPIAIDLGDTQ